MWKRSSCHVTSLAERKIYHKFGTVVHVVLLIFVNTWKKPSCHVTCLALSKIYHKFATVVHAVLLVYVIA